MCHHIVIQAFEHTGIILACWQSVTPCVYQPEDTRHFCLTLNEDLICPETEEDIAIFFAWCFGVGEKGVMPKRNHLNQILGSPWSNMCGQDIGHRLSFSAWTGDLKEPGTSEQSPQVNEHPSLIK